MSTRPRILCLSLSPIDRDARVLRQLAVLAQHGDVTTVGYGAQPQDAVEHLRIPDDARSLPQQPSGVALLAARRWHRAEMAAPGAQAALEALRGREFDLVVANEARILPVAAAVAGKAPIWADMHEWAPGEQSHILVWRLLVAPLMDHVCEEYLPQCAAVTTVSQSIAELYDATYGTSCSVVRNARPFSDLEPTPLREEGVIRLVHSGAADASRNIESLITACKAVPNTELTLVLVPAGDGGRFLRRLQEQAADCSRIRFVDPVTPAQLPATLNAHDIGIYSLPPANINMELALPNKFFDFVQGRLGLVIGPTAEMSRLVNDYRLGLVADDFSDEALIRSLRSLTPASVTAFKAASHASAHELSNDTDLARMHRIVSDLVGP